MTERNDLPRNEGLPSGDLGVPDGTPETGRSLDDGRVQFAPRELVDKPATDDEVAARVRALMTAEGWVDVRAIEVHVREGEATLEGSVASEEERRLAENIALAVAAVRVVHNRLQIHLADTQGLPGE